MDLSSLIPSEVPEVVGPAVRRFTVKVVLLTLAVPALWVLLPWGVATLWHNWNADFYAVRDLGAFSAPASRGEMKRFADVRFYNGNSWKSWRAYSWRGQKSIRGHLPACWAVFLKGSRQPASWCRGPDWGQGEAVQSSVSAIQEMAGYTVVAGVAPAEARRLDVIVMGETSNSDSVYSAKMSSVKGTGLRVFAALVARPESDVHPLRFDVRDGRDKPVAPLIPYHDQREGEDQPDEAKAAANAAVAASGDPAAIPYSLRGPTLFQNATLGVNVVDLDVDPQLVVYEVSLKGMFPRPGARPDVRPAELVTFIVAAGTNHALAEIFPAR